MVVGLATSPAEVAAVWASASFSLSVLTPVRVARHLSVLAALALVAAFLGIALGPSGLAPGEVWRALVGDAEGAVADIVWRVRVPRVAQALQPFVTTVPMQLLAYYVADLKGTDVDQPRNLAKSVTVE